MPSRQRPPRSDGLRKAVAWRQCAARPRPKPSAPTYAPKPPSGTCRQAHSNRRTAPGYSCGPESRRGASRPRHSASRLAGFRRICGPDPAQSGYRPCRAAKLRRLARRSPPGSADSSPARNCRTFRQARAPRRPPVPRCRQAPLPQRRGPWHRPRNVPPAACRFSDIEWPLISPVHLTTGRGA